ncbi:MAG TPA: LysR family transcriptional regulator, partial [Myxococcota bacterium]|nr:LysR family transcriptional regulator [Myxococcota bacterium]
MDIELVRIFTKVVQQQSFSKAAALLRLPKATVSRSVSRLERQTGTKLLVRTTRSVSTTSAGLAFYDAASASVQVLEAALRALQGQDSALSGTVRLTAPEDLGAHIISPAIAALSRAHGALAFELHYTDEVVD